MSKQYTLLSETKLPYHEGDEFDTTIRIYDVDEETYEELLEAKLDGPENRVSRLIREDLGLSSTWLTVRNMRELYRSYKAELFAQRCVIVTEVVGRKS